MMLKLKLQYFGHLMKSWLIGKDSDAGRDWGQEEKGTTEDEMAGREFEWTPGVGLGQRGLACCNSWGHRVGHDWATELNWCNIALYSIRPCFYHQLHPQLGIFALARSPVAYWPPTDMVSSSFSILSFCLSYCSWGSQGKNTEGVCHSLLQWTKFCQNSAPWPVHLRWPYMAWLIVSLS